MANQTNLTAEQIEAVNSYSKSIQTLKDHVTAVRQMPAMYISGVSPAGYLSMIREVFQNSIDQIIMKESPANWASFFYDENTLVFRSTDNGLSLPFNDMIRIITTPNTSKNYVKKKGEYSSGRHGSGIKAVNALSEYLIAEAYRYDGKAMRLVTKEGYPQGDLKSIPNKSKFNGTMIEFVPSAQVFGDDLHLDWKRVYNLIKQIISRTPIGTTVDFEAIDKQGVSHKEKIINKDGIIRDLIERSQHPLCKPIKVFKDTGEMLLEAAFLYDAGDKDGPEPQEQVVSFCNMCPCIGTHLNGTIDGITKFFTQYMNNIFLASNNQQKNKKNVLKVIPADIKSGLIVSINAAMLLPDLIGQSKEILSNPEMEDFSRNVVLEGLQEWAKNNPNDLLKLCKYFKDIAELRIKQNNEKVKIVNKYQANTITGYPDKYVKPLKQKKEFVIVEGDSAAGTVTKGRDINTQGMFPIRGKIPNAFRTPRNAFLANAEVQGIIKIVTGQDASRFNRNFDPVKDVEWEKIIFMADTYRCL